MTRDEKMDELISLQLDLMRDLRNAETEIERLEIRERLDAVEREIVELCDVRIEVDE